MQLEIRKVFEVGEVWKGKIVEDVFPDLSMKDGFDGEICDGGCMGLEGGLDPA